MPLRLSIINVPRTELVGSLVVLLLSTLLVVWLAARIYRVGLLMYGKRPTLRELGRWIRYGGWSPDWQLRLYHRSRARWEGGKEVWHAADRAGMI